MDEARSAPGGSGDEGPAAPRPNLAESLRRIGASGRAGLAATGDAAQALRALIAADLALAGSAFGHAVAVACVALVFVGSAWLLLMATLAAALHELRGWSWPLALGTCAALSLALAAIGLWQTLNYLQHTRLQATRRQLARLGVGKSSTGIGPDAGTSPTARGTTEPKPS